MLFWLPFSCKSIQNILILSAIVAPFASTGIRSVVNRLNRDTTVYYGLVFCELRSNFLNPAGARKNTSNEQNVRLYYMLNHRIRGLLFHYKKKLSGNWLLFFGKSIQRHPDSLCENDVNN